MNNATTVAVDTKADKNSESITTNLTIDWEGMTTLEIQELAQQALIVKLQSGWRKNGIPNGDHTVKAVDHKVGTRAARGPVTAETLLAKLSPEEKAKLLAKLMGEG